MGGATKRFNLIRSLLSLSLSLCRSSKQIRGFKVSNQHREPSPIGKPVAILPLCPAAVPSKWETRREGGPCTVRSSACSRLKKQRNDLSPIISACPKGWARRRYSLGTV